MWYLTAVFLSFIVWLLIFLSRKDLRAEMLITGLFVFPFVIIDILTVPSYWNPKTLFDVPVGIEAYLFTFFLAGIASVFYEFIFSRKNEKSNKIYFSNLWVFAFPLLITILVQVIFTLNTIYPLLIFLFSSGIAIILARKDLSKNFLYSAILFGALYFIVINFWFYLNPSLINWWNLKNISGILVLRAPLEEIIFGIAIGGLIGPLYEYMTSKT